MSVREIQDQKTIAREMVVQQPAHANANVPASPLRGATICSTKSRRRRDFTLESTADEFCEAADASLLPVNRADANLMRVLRQLEVIAKRQAPRIAFKVKGSILLLDLADILAVQAEGNYVSLRPRTNLYLVRESLSSMAEKLKTLRFYSHPPLGRREYFGRGEDSTFTDGGVQTTCKGWEGILGNAHIQTQPQRSGSIVGRIRAALRLTGSKKFYLDIPRSIPDRPFSKSRPVSSAAE